MQFLTWNQVANQPFIKEYKYPVATSALGLLVAAAVMAASTIAIVHVSGQTIVGLLLLAWIAFWFAIFTLVLFKLLRDRLRPTNWLVRLQTNGLMVKYRSYLNSSLPEEDSVAVFIDFSEIESIRRHDVERNIPGSTVGDDELRSQVYAELQLRNKSQVGELETHLAAERKRPGPYMKTWYGGRRTALSRHYPVQVTSESVVRIEWSVRPKLSHFLDELKPYLQAAPPVRSSVDYRKAGELPRKEQEEILIELLQAGDRIGATRTARHLYGFDTTRAVQFLEELSPTYASGSSRSNDDSSPMANRIPRT
jgi:hypothetical protein